MSYHFSSRVPESDSDPVGDILKVAGNPAVISFAGGLPAPELFPVKAIAQAAETVFKQHGQAALQYAGSQGILPLRQVAADRVKIDGINTDPDHVMVTTGSQQAIDLTGKLFLDPGDTVIVEQPTYLCAVDVFRSYGASFVGVEMDDDGMKMDALEQALIDHPKTRLIYTIPNFQNPTGRTMPADRRRRMAELADEYDVMILEDNPYGAIRFAGENVPSIKSFDRTGHVIYMSTFSKILAPGIRLGWIVVDSDKLMSKYLLMKQSADLHSDNLAQYIVAQFCQTNDVQAHIERISSLYRERCQLMIDSIKKYFPENVVYSQPEGGMFIWVRVPGVEDTQALFQECIRHDVAFVPGDPFFAGKAQAGTFRLNYSNMQKDRIVIGIQRLGAAIKAAIAQRA